MHENSEPIKFLQSQLSTLPPALPDVLSDALQCVTLNFLTWTNYESLKLGQYFSLSQTDPVKWSHPLEEKDNEVCYVCVCVCVCVCV